MTVHNALREIFTLATPTDSAHNISDIQDILVGRRANTVYKAAFSRDLSKAVTEPAFLRLARELHIYMSSSAKSRTSFDSWHEGVCDAFLSELNSCSPRQKKYGKAQKALNMSAKYLYCCEDTLPVSEQEKFDHFHIALDGYTYIENPTNYPLSFYRDVVIPWKYGHMPHGTVRSWSQLEKEDYRKAVKNVRDFFAVPQHSHTFNEYLKACHTAGILTSISPVPINEDRNLTPFEAEFFLWEICKKNRPSVFTALF
jgi:hypothetical protein